MPTLDYQLAARFWEIDDPQLAVLLYSIVGGTPAYRDGMAGGRGPQSIADLDPWVTENVLSRFSPLFREARYLLAEEPDIRDNAVYHSVLSAVAEGTARAEALPATWSARPPTSPTTCRSSRMPGCSRAMSTSSALAAACTGSASR